MKPIHIFVLFMSLTWACNNPKGKDSGNGTDKDTTASVSYEPIT